MRCVYSDRVLKDMMVEVMQNFDNDDNKIIDREEFEAIITDSDVDMLFSLYGPRDEKAHIFSKK